MRYLLQLFCIIIIFNSCANKKIPSASGRAAGQIKVMSYNVHHCNPPSKNDVIDIDAIAKTIARENPDLVALQEIDVNVNRSGKKDQLHEIAARAGYEFFYFSKAIDYDGGDYGVAILSRYPLSETQTFRLPTEASTKGEPRVLSLATISLPGGRKIKFGSTHFDAQHPATNRLLQAKEINRISGDIKMPLIIAGDFNAEENSEVMKIIQSEFLLSCSNCAPTIPVVTPVKTIDFIAFRPKNHFTAVLHKVVPEHYASDHLPVVAVLELK